MALSGGTSRAGRPGDSHPYGRPPRADDDVADLVAAVDAAMGLGDVVEVVDLVDHDGDLAVSDSRGRERVITRSCGSPVCSRARRTFLLDQQVQPAQQCRRGRNADVEGSS